MIQSCYTGSSRGSLSLCELGSIPRVTDMSPADRRDAGHASIGIVSAFCLKKCASRKVSDQTCSIEKSRDHARALDQGNARDVKNASIHGASKNQHLNVITR